MGFLTDKVAEVRRELERSPLDEGALMARALSMPPPRDLAAALRARRPAIVAEVKRASPSAGSIAEHSDAGEQARAYTEGGAAAISVLTEQRHFHGSIADLRAVRTATALPVLRKDFLVHPSQLIESRAAGADAVLLICGCLSRLELESLLEACSDLGLAALVETHAAEDLEPALESGAELIGVNARDLETLEVDVGGAMERLRRIPPDRLAVLESGIFTRAHVEAAMAAGASGILVGEALMAAADPRAVLRMLLADDRSDRRESPV